MDYPVLYTFRRCPYAMRARMTLRYAGICVEHREVALKNKPNAMLAASPKGTVPVLVLPSQQVLDESLDIMVWALEQADPAGWRARDAQIQMQWVARCDIEFKPQLDLYKYHNHKPEQQWLPARDAGEQYLAELNAQLVKSGSAPDGGFLFGNSLSFADVAILPFVRQFANVDSQWFAGLDYGCLQAWLARLLADDLFLDVMVKRPPWTPGDAPVRG